MTLKVTSISLNKFPCALFPTVTTRDLRDGTLTVDHESKVRVL